MTHIITRERYAQGITVQQFIDSMTRNQEKFKSNYAAAQIAEDDKTFFASLPHPVHILVLAEDWCGDVIAGLPYVAKLADAAGAPDVRVFLRDQNLDIMDAYLKEGLYRSIPVFVLLDADFNEIGFVIERSPRATMALVAAAQHVLTDRPDLAPAGTGPFEFDKMTEEGKKAVSAAITQARSEHGDEWNRDLLADFKAIVTRHVQ